MKKTSSLPASLAVLSTCWLALAAPGAARAGTVVAQHNGSTNPTAEGWTAGGSGTGVTAGPVNDTGVAAWAMDDNSTVADSLTVYSRSLTFPEVDAAEKRGWTLTARLRVTDPATTSLPSPFAGFHKGERGYQMLFGAKANGDAEVHLYPGGPVFTITGGASAYHTYSLVSDPHTGTADLFVDGVERLSNYAGFNSTGTYADWGVGGSGHDGGANFAFVELSTAAGGLLNPAGIWNLDGNFDNALPAYAPLLPAGLINGTDFTFATDESGYQHLQVQPFAPAIKRLTVANPITPNGGPGATRTNQWTVVMDVKFDALQTYAGFLQLDPANAGDVTIYVFSTDNLNGQLNSGLSSPGAIAVNTWNRLAITSGNDGAGGPVTVKFYLNGVLNGTPRTVAFDGALALQSSFHLFADNNNELKPAKLNSFALWGQELSASNIASLGGPQSGGIQPGSAQYWWKNFAGKPGGAGTVDGTGSAARFNGPAGLAVDGGGNIFLADTGNHTIRKVTPAGGVSTIGGRADYGGSTDGPGSVSRFAVPQGVTRDPAGNLYIADAANDIIRKIDPAGQVSTFAGLSGVSGTTDGIASAARFDNPAGICRDPAGNLYIADTGNQTIRKIDPTGNVTTLAGGAGFVGAVDGLGGNARFRSPRGVTWDTLSGGLYVADDNNNTIRKISSAGLVSTFAGTALVPGSADGQGPAARFSRPTGVAVDSGGNVFVTDSQNHTIRRITPAGLVTTFAGTAGQPGTADGTAGAARLLQPNGLAIDSSANLWVTGNHTLRKITAAAVVTTVAGLPGFSGTEDGTGTLARFSLPYDAAVDSGGDLFVTDNGNRRLRKISAQGEVTTPPGFIGSNPIYYPGGITGDAAANIYFTDFQLHTVRKLNPAGVVMTLAGSTGNPGSQDGQGTAARFNQPVAIIPDGSGDFYVGDWSGHTIRKMTAAGAVTTVAGTKNESGYEDGPALSARFFRPRSLALASNGNLYISDESNNKIRKLVPGAGAMVSTVAGGPGLSDRGSMDGAAGIARFYRPHGIAADRKENVYVVDWGNHSIRKIAPGGGVTTIGGMSGSASSVDGYGSAARFSQPNGIFFTSSGVVYVVDSGNSRISRGTLYGSLAAWRLEHFQVTEDAGNAANLFDYDHDGLVNLVEYAFGTNPLTGGSEVLPQIQQTGSELRVSFLQPVSVSGITYGAEWSTTLAAGSWTPIPDSSMGQFHLFTLPVTDEPRMFMRLTVREN